MKPRLDSGDFYSQSEVIARLRSMIRHEHMPEGYDVADDATTEFAVEIAEKDEVIARLTKALKDVTTRMNKVTSRWRHTKGYSRKEMDDLCNIQIEADDALASAPATEWDGQERRKAGWVSVSERLPDVDVYVLWTTPGGRMHVFEMDKDMTWEWIVENSAGDPPTHWMPLPEPPSGKA